MEATGPAPFHPRRRGGVDHAGQPAMILAGGWVGWAWLALAAVVVGFSKTAVAGLGPVATVMFTLVMPAKEATGAILLLLIACDLVAIVAYRRDCNWALVRVLVPTLIPGIALGALFVCAVDDTVLRRTVGGLLFVMCLAQFIQTVAHTAKRRGAADDAGGPAATPTARAAGAATRASDRIGTAVAGTAAGFTTMTANAAGPVMSLFLLWRRVPKLAFVGTSAWFYFFANLVKLPFAIGIGTVQPGSLSLNLLLVVPALAGCGLGLWALPRIEQTTFNRLALALALGASLLLLR